MNRGRWFGALAIVALTSVLWARQGAVHLNNGAVITGDVDDSDPDKVIVIDHGVRESLARADVASIEYTDDLDEQFESRLARLGANDVAGRLNLARWVDGFGRHDLARRAAADALAVDPSNPQAKELLSTFNYEAALAKIAPAPPPAPATRAVLAPPSASRNANPPPRPYLSLDQVNEIRQIELKPDDTFRVSFEHDVRNRFLARGEIDRVSFFALPEQDQARRILATGDAALARDVRIDSDPASLDEFRLHISPLILGGCAVSGCHSTETAAGGFYLFTGDVSPPAEYTNFYLLQAYEKPSAVRGGVMRVMIDRTHPEESLLAQYSLPRDQAAPPHPAVDNLRPIYMNRFDPRYAALVQWISLLLKPEGGSYPDIHYPATQPAGGGGGGGVGGRGG